MKPFWLAFSVLLVVALACAPLPETPGVVTVTPLQPSTETPVTAPLPQGEAIALQAGYGYRGSFYEIYFTDPFRPASQKQEGGIDVPLARAIDEARISVEVAVYSMSLNSIRDALLNAHRRGVQVRIVMESDNLDRPVPRLLAEKGIPLLGDRREGLMHNKFVIIDRSEVWTGSMNFTNSGAYEDNNNLVRIRSAQVAENYLTEFEEMFEEDFFGPDTLPNTPYPQLTLQGVPVEIYFSPDDGVAARIVRLLREARASIYFLAYSLTADDFGDLLRQKAQEGLRVFGVMEEEQVKSNRGGEFETLQQAGLNVFLDGNPGQMHHKVIIIDEKIVITGSYNFSASAERKNDENVMIFFDEQIARQYLAEFERVFARAQRR
ncbi:MAG: phospholipase D-like domain-containing protein [Anaerolineales bacterium]|nr:phospholipase D-like domain-containing protein [Anaerolineales bacterium]MCX7753880.1 phospholipase D-like domain-containing protein [Anaerolineales bacterium]MDW8276834.1 phospholipase D-like domain-containing protein [Anaerolineales bacterium]